MSGRTGGEQVGVVPEELDASCQREDSEEDASDLEPKDRRRTYDWTPDCLAETLASAFHSFDFAVYLFRSMHGGLRNISAEFGRGRRTRAGAGRGLGTGRLSGRGGLQQRACSVASADAKSLAKTDAIHTSSLVVRSGR